jgi:hypothetical protein
MKKIILFLGFMFAAVVNVQAVNVSSASYFKGLYNSDGQQDIFVLNNITFDGSGQRLGDNGTDLNMTVDLSGKELFFKNSAYTGSGGVMNLTRGAIIFKNGMIHFTSNSMSQFNNSSSGGGAIYNFDGTLTISSSAVDFTSNSAITSGTYSGGGAIYNNSGTLTISSSAVNFTSNSAITSGTYSGGGAIYNSNTAS